MIYLCENQATSSIPKKDVKKTKEYKRVVIESLARIQVKLGFQTQFRNIFLMFEIIESGKEKQLYNEIKQGQFILFFKFQVVKEK